MFEDEIKMEEKSSNVAPLLVAIGLVLAVAGGIAYFILGSKRSMSDAEATQVANSLLNAEGPERLHFEVGFVEPSVNEKPFDPQYRFLQKIGVVKLGKPSAKGLDVTLTPGGQELLKESGATEEKNSDGTEGYTAPIANRKLLKVSRIEMLNPGRANIEFEWNWEPTKLGWSFDVGSPEMASMNSWDRGLLIQKYGADYYKDSKVKKKAVALIWDDTNNTWKPLEQ